MPGTENRLHIAVLDSLVFVFTGSSVRTPSIMNAYRNAPGGAGAVVVSSHTPLSLFVKMAPPGEPGVCGAGVVPGMANVAAGRSPALSVTAAAFGA